MPISFYLYKDCEFPEPCDKPARFTTDDKKLWLCAEHYDMYRIGVGECARLEQDHNLDEMIADLQTVLRGKVL